MNIRLPVYIGPDAIDELVRFASARDLTRFALIADDPTYGALGRRVEAALRGRGWDVRTALLAGDDIVADAHYVFQAMLALDRTPRTYLAVGSGTITDIVRFISHRAAADFISLPTAASVDGFTSIGAPMIIDGAKITVSCQGPLAVFADLPTLCDAPQPLIAAGFGDMIAKLTSVADWELGSLLWDEPFDAAIATRARRAAWACAEQIGEIAACHPEGIRALMAGLIESGFCMLDFGETRPASGWEHHMSHFWEMKLLREGRKSILHGAKVGVGVLISARGYDAVREMSRDEARTRLATARLPDPAAEIRGLRAAHGLMADQVIAIQKPFLEMTEEAFGRLKRKILDNWAEIQRIAASVPPSADLERWLRQVGGPVRGEEIGFSSEEIALGVHWAHGLKDRITIGKLSRILGIV